MSNSGQTPAGNRTPFLAFTSDPESVAVLKQFCAKLGWSDTVIHEGDIDAATAFLKGTPSPHVLCVDVASAEAAPAALDKLADVCDPGIKVIVSSKINEYSFYSWLVEVGISNYLLKPFTLAALEAAYKKATDVPVVAHEAAAVAAETKKDGRIITVIGTRGGVGASTIAVNLAWLLGHKLQQKTALLDFDPQLGTVALALDLEPGRGLREVLEKPERIDGLFMDRVMVRMDEYLSILSTEESLEENVSASAAAAEALFKQTRPKFSHIVVDVPRTLSPYTRYALGNSDHIICVTEYTIMGLRESLRYLEYCRDILKVRPPIFVASRTGMAGKHQMPNAEFEKGLGHKVDFNVPFILDAYAAATAGELLAETTKNAPVLKALHALAAHFVDGAETKEPKAKKGLMGVLKGGK
jgi:pilus assembly protein CpaE